MLSGILLTAGSIACMCVSGIVVTTVYSWFGNLEIELPKKKKDKRNYEDGSNETRITNLKNRAVKPTDF